MEKLQLSGFSELESGADAKINKTISTYTAKFEKICKNFERLQLTVKRVHKKEKSEKYEIIGKLLDNGKTFGAEAVDLNLILALDKVLAKLEHEIAHVHYRKK